jgi:antitoxin CptB
VGHVGRVGVSLVFRMIEPLDAEIKRLRWRCRRGMRELDVLMLRYLDQGWPIASDNERKLFLQLLECEDDKLWRWFMGLETPEETHLVEIIAIISELPSS